MYFVQQMHMRMVSNRYLQDVQWQHSLLNALCHWLLN